MEHQTRLSGFALPPPDRRRLPSTFSVGFIAAQDIRVGIDFPVTQSGPSAVSSAVRVSNTYRFGTGKSIPTLMLQAGISYDKITYGTSVRHHLHEVLRRSPVYSKRSLS